MALRYDDFVEKKKLRNVELGQYMDELTMADVRRTGGRGAS